MISAPPGPVLSRGKPLVMGIVNVTPDSFSDGGRFDATQEAVAHVQKLVAEGADIVDLGGESTRPGFTKISTEQELERILPVLDALTGSMTVPVSIDTTKPEVARQALKRGVAWVNDIWGLQGDPAMAGTVAEFDATVVIMHNQTVADDRLDIADAMERFFTTSLAVAEWAGIPRGHIVLDPGIGFGKTPRQQWEALRAIPRLLSFALPIMVGVSRKGFLGRLTGAPVGERLTETLAANLGARALGASMFRVHDVAAHVAALNVFSQILAPLGTP